jgi:hypothetical protein
MMSAKEASVKEALVFDGTSKNVTPNRSNDDDHKVDIRGSNGDWRLITSLAFITELPPGHVQEVETGDDVIRNIQQNQQVDVLGRQDTTALGQLTISSREAAIYVTAKTQIVLEVGASRIIMKDDGTIEIVCKDLIAKATNTNTIIGQRRVDINPRGTFETTEPAPPPPASPDPASPLPAAHIPSLGELGVP